MMKCVTQSISLLLCSKVEVVYRFIFKNNMREGRRLVEERANERSKLK